MIGIARGKASRKAQRGGEACSESRCRKSVEGRCEHCGEPFCRDHLKAKPSKLFGILQGEVPESTKELIEKEWETPGGHSCKPYFGVWLKKKGAKIKEREEGERAEFAITRTAAVRKRPEPKEERPRKEASSRKRLPEAPGRQRRVPKSLIVIVFFLAAVGAALHFGKDSIAGVYPMCSDGTAPDTCSASKPLYCSGRTLLEKSSVCGCPDGYFPRSEGCGKPFSCLDNTESGKCSATRPLLCEDGKLLYRASVCGCPEYFTPPWVNSSPMWNLSTPTKYSNPKWYTNTLTFTISRDCAKLQRDNMAKAIYYIANNTGTSLKFIEVEDGCPQITVRCLNVTSSLPLEQGVAETAVTKRNEGYYSVITGAEITVTLGSQGCDPPVTQIHQVLHAMGFDHVADPSSMLYSKFGCLQALKSSIRDDLAQIYPKV